MTRPRKGPTAEEGSGTVLVVAVLVVAVVLAGFVAGAGSLRARQVEVQAVADLAALAAADVSASATWSDVGSRPCDRALQVARANGMEVGTCEVLGADTRLRVSRHVLIGGLAFTVGAGARAGPVGP